MEIAKKALEFINDFVVALQSAKLYSPAHKRFEEAIDKTYKVLREILREKKALVIGIIGDDFAFESEIFFDYSANTIAQGIINSFKEKGIEKIIFNSWVSREELRAFIAHLAIIREKGDKIGAQELIVLNIENITIDKITSPISEHEAKKKDEENKFIFYKNYLNKVSEYLQAILKDEEVDHLSLKLNILSILENIYNIQRFLSLAPLKIRSSFPIVHTVNVSILTMYFCLRLGFTKEEILEMTVAALFHDIGRFRIAAKKDSNIRHSELGAEMLIKYTKALGLLPVLVSFEHHIRHDAKENPRLKIKYKPHIASSIISICDAYDLFCQRRSPKYDYSPSIIYNLMMRRRGEVFNSDLLGFFFRIIGVWPVGTIVLLSDKSVGIVWTENENEMSKPKIKLTEYLTSKIIDLKYNEELKIVKALNPFTEGKPYLDSI